MWEYVKLHMGKVVGLGVGLFFSLIFLFFGFWKMLIVLIILSISFYIGDRLDRNESIEELIRRFFPDDFFKRNHP